MWEFTKKEEIKEPRGNLTTARAGKKKDNKGKKKDPKITILPRRRSKRTGHPGKRADCATTPKKMQKNTFQLRRKLPK